MAIPAMPEMEKNVAFVAPVAEIQAGYEALGIEELRAKCESRQMNTAGLKDELVSRLVEKELKAQSRKKLPPDELILPPAGMSEPSSAHSVSALDLAQGPRTPAGLLPPLRANANGKLPPSKLPPLDKKKLAKKKRQKPPASAEEARDLIMKDLVSNAFEWPSDDVAQRHEDRTMPRSSAGQEMSCWAPEVDVEFMGLLGALRPRVLRGPSSISPPLVRLNVFSARLRIRSI